MAYQIDIEKVTCGCSDFKFRRARHPKGSIERRCKHLAEVMKDIPIKESKTWSEKQRHPRSKVVPIAKKIEIILSHSRHIEKFEYCGSYRRGRSTIGDLDVVIVLKKDNWDYGPTIIKSVEQIASKTMVSGKQKTSLVIDGVQVDLRFVYASTFLTQIMHATGSARENIRLRAIAKKKGMALSEYGLRGTDKKFLPNLNSEQDIYKAIGVTYVEPKNR